MNLETKIPPPAICFICALLMCISAQVSALAGILPRFPILLSVVLMVFGTALGVLGVWAFRRVRTTVSPLNPEQTEHFVSDGVYRFSRNLNFVFNSIVLIAIPKINVLLGFGSSAVV